MGKNKKEKKVLLFPYEEQLFDEALQKQGFTPWLILFPLAGILLMLTLYNIDSIPSLFTPFIIFIPLFLGCGFFLRWKRENFSNVFRKIHISDIWLILLFIVLSIIISLCIAVANIWPTFMKTVEMLKANPNIDTDTANKLILETISEAVTLNPIASSGELKTVSFWVFWFPIQIIGEELLKFSAFITVFSSGYFILSKGKFRKLWIVISILISMVVFGLMHINAYGNIWHCLLTIGFGSILNYILLIKTKNLWVTWAEHFFYDVVLLVMTM